MAGTNAATQRPRNVRAGCVDLEPFREAFHRQQRTEQLTIGEVAGRMGEDRERVARLLGAAPDRTTRRMRDGTTRRYVRTQRGCSPEVGERLMRALHLDPFDVGL